MEVLPDDSGDGSRHLTVFPSILELVVLVTLNTHAASTSLCVSRKSVVHWRESRADSLFEVDDLPGDRRFKRLKSLELTAKIFLRWLS